MMKTVRRIKTVRILLQGVMLLAFFGAFWGGGALTARLMRYQAGPLLLRPFCGLSAAVLALALFLLLLTWLFGRFFCGFCCPFGTFQDLFRLLPGRGKRRIPDLPFLRLLSAGVAFGLSAAGWSVGFLLLDPYSQAGRMISGASLAAGAAWFFLILLVLWKKRIFCTALCPVGALLGLSAAKGVYRLQIRNACVRCGKCAMRCPAGAVDVVSGKIDNERCLRCMECLCLCPKGAIVFAPEKRRALASDLSRRDFLIRGGILLGGLAAGFALAQSGIRKRFPFASRTKIFPPGAGEMFPFRCTACQLCVKNCPEKIIVPGEYGIGPVSLDLNLGACRYDCRRCSQLCPTGALKPLTLEEKQRTKIAEASFNPRNCLVFQEEKACGKCAAVCPAGAIRLRKSGAPYPVDTERCIGCGACRNVCPAENKAITIREINQQQYRKA